MDFNCYLPPECDYNFTGLNLELVSDVIELKDLESSVTNPFNEISVHNSNKGQLGILTYDDNVITIDDDVMDVDEYDATTSNINENSVEVQLGVITYDDNVITIDDVIDVDEYDDTTSNIGENSSDGQLGITTHDDNVIIDDDVIDVDEYDDTRSNTSENSNDGQLGITHANNVITSDDNVIDVDEFDDTSYINREDDCAVVLCNHYARSHAIKIFYINFPNNDIIRANWWEICGRNDTYNPSAKICSIHFKKEDFIFREQIRDGQRYIHTALATLDVKPTLYLQSHEYLKFSRAPKKNATNDTNNESDNIEMDDIPSTSTVYYTSTSALKKSDIKPIKQNNDEDESDNIEMDDIPSTSTVYYYPSTSTSALKKSDIKSIKQDNDEEIPESIMFDNRLTESFGEMLPPCCNLKCTSYCFYCILNIKRRVIYDEFHKLGTETEKNCKIAELVGLSTVEIEGGILESSVLHYSLMDNQVPTLVCRNFFLNTLGITERRLDSVLIPINYNWYCNRDTVIKANQPKQMIDKPIMTDFIKNSLPPLMKESESESDTEVSIDNVPKIEFKKVINFIKSITKASKYQNTKTNESRCFETSIYVEHMYQKYSKHYVRNNTKPPYTQNQFKKIYNIYMKNLKKF